MMLIYHQKALDLLQIAPEASGVAMEAIAAFEAHYNIHLPAALHEWYSIDRELHWLAKIAGAHSPVALAEVWNIQKYYSSQSGLAEPFPILVENQAVWHMAIMLSDGDDPPVYVRFYEEGKPWQLHARSFSDWIWALAWDHMTIDYPPQNIWYLKSAQRQAQFRLADFDFIGPETFAANAVFIGNRFVRVTKGGQRLLVVFPETEE
jgi:hypothetical protein